MGQICTKKMSHVIIKDPADKSVEQIILKPTNVQEFDETFSSARDSIVTLIAMNNNFVDAIESVKEASAVFQGECKVVIVVHQDFFSMRTVVVNQNGIESDVSESDMNKKQKKNENLKGAKEDLENCIEVLNKSFQIPTNKTLYKMKRTRITIVQSGRQDRLINSLNLAVFVYRKELMMLCNRKGIKGAFLCLHEEIDKHTLDCCPRPSFTHGAMRIVYGEENSNFDQEYHNLPYLVRCLKEAFDQLEVARKFVRDTLPQVSNILNIHAGKAKAFPPRAPDACRSAGLEGVQLITTVKNTSYNVHALCGAREITTECLNFVIQVAAELREASTDIM